MISVDPIECAAILIKRHEGFEQFPYKCPANKLTIGYGRNIEEVGISKREASFLLHRDIEERVVFLETFSFWKYMDSVRRTALIDMTYQLGGRGFSNFKKAIAALTTGDYKTAHDEILDSKYAKHDTPERARRIAKMILGGEK